VNVKKRIALIGVLVIFIFISLMTGAVNFDKYLEDKENDVTNPDIDIIEAWSDFNKDYILFNVKVLGKINNNCTYTFTVTNGKEEVGLTYTNKKAFCSLENTVEYEIKDNNTLTLKIPSNLFKSWKKFDFNVMATDKRGEWDYMSSFKDMMLDDPAQKEPTDKNIKIKITYVKYEIKRVEKGKWYARYLIKGITNGVDHVSLNFVTYYNNGSFKKEKWIRGPITIYNESFLGTEINVFYFNSTKRNWKEWKFEVEAKYPVNESKFKWTNQKKEIKKYSIIARAYRDAGEKYWSQAVYDTKPVFTKEGVYYIPKKSPDFSLSLLIFCYLLLQSIKKLKA